MIVFDLDTLADDTHRRHFINPLVCKGVFFDVTNFVYGDNTKLDPVSGEIWQPDYGAYNAACGDDVLIEPVWIFTNLLFQMNKPYLIWTNRCESTKELTLSWLSLHDIQYIDLKMRPIGNTEPAHVLKERWLNQLSGNSGQVDFVFDCDPDCIDMFRQRGVYVFDCRQG